MASHPDPDPDDASNDTNAADSDDRDDPGECDPGAYFHGLEAYTREDFEEIGDKFRHREGDVAALDLELPTALVAQVALELNEDQTVAEWIHGAIWNRLAVTPDDAEEIEVEVPLDEAQWDRLRLYALARQQAGDDRDGALLAWDGWNVLVDIAPAPIVDGERKSIPEDLVDVDADDCS